MEKIWQLQESSIKAIPVLPGALDTEAHNQAEYKELLQIPQNIGAFKDSWGFCIFRKVLSFQMLFLLLEVE